MSSKKQIKSALESMMFVWGEPLEVKVCAEMFDMSKEETEALFFELADEYEQEGRGIVIRQVNKGFQFVTRPENGEFIERLCRPVKVKKLSQSALEVLAIIAYKQPVTKGEIDAIRGIKCDRVVDGLMKKDLICVKGRSEGVGRPMLYGTTDTFLKQFGFATLKELPDIEDIEGVIGGSGSGSEAGSGFGSGSGFGGADGHGGGADSENDDDDGFDGGYDDGWEQISIEGIDMGGGLARDGALDTARTAGEVEGADITEMAGEVENVDTARTADEVESVDTAGMADEVESADTAGTAGEAEEV